MALGLASIAAVVVVTALVSAGLVKEKHYPYGIALMAAGLVYSTTLLGSYVVGSDIQGELSASRSVMQSGWDFTSATDTNAIIGINLTSVVTGFMAPALSRLLHMDLVWVYKAVLPLFLIAVPVVMYYVFKGQMGGKRAFYATLFFIAVPVYSLQITQIVKSMVAELFFALAILAMVTTWRERYKAAAIVSCTMLAIASHYTVGIVLLAFLLGIAVARAATSRMSWTLWSVRRASLATLIAALVLGSGAFYAYYHYAYGGAVNRVLSGVVKVHGNAATLYAGRAVESMTAAAGTTATPPVPVSPRLPTAPGPVTIPAAPSPPAAKNYLYNQEYTVQVGIGLDFLDQPVDGKMFRVIQYLTQLLIVVGAVRLLVRPTRYAFTAEFISGIGCSFALLLACVFVPQFSIVINMPRFYQLSLFFLAPMLVLGCEAMSGRPGDRQLKEAR